MAVGAAFCERSCVLATQALTSQRPRLWLPSHMAQPRFAVLSAATRTRVVTRCAEHPLVSVCVCGPTAVTLVTVFVRVVLLPRSAATSRDAKWRCIRCLLQGGSRAGFKKETCSGAEPKWIRAIDGGIATDDEVLIDDTS